MNTPRCLKVLPALALLSACATTSLTAVRDPAFQGRTFHRIVVVAPFTDLEKKATAEDAFVQALQAQGAQALPAMTVLPPTRDYSNEDINAALQAAGANGVLFVTLTDTSVSSTYVPGSTTTTGSGYGTATTYGSTTTGTVNWKSTTRQNPGYYIKKPQVRFEVRLVDAPTGATAWVGTSLTKGNAYAGWGTLMNSLASEVAYKLAVEGLVKKQ